MQLALERLLTQTLYGGGGDDMLVAECLDSPVSLGERGLLGEAGGDTLYAVEDCYILSASGGSGSDTITLGDLPGEAEGGSGDDLITGSPYDDVLYGGSGGDTIYGGGGNDEILGEAGVDALHGQAGDDQIDGGSGGDTLYGGAGSNTLCGGGAGSSAFDTLVSTGEDTLWAPYAPGDGTPVASTTGFNDVCGHASWGTGWVAGYCAYTLKAEPSSCP